MQANSTPTVERQLGRPPLPLVPVPRRDRTVLLFGCAAPARAADFRADEERRVWIVDPDWFLVERDEPGTRPRPHCVSVVYDMQGALHCTCAAGLKRIGCPHVLAIGERSAGWEHRSAVHLTRAAERDFAKQAAKSDPAASPWTT